MRKCDKRAKHPYRKRSILSLFELRAVTPSLQPVRPRDSIILLQGAQLFPKRQDETHKNEAQLTLLYIFVRIFPAVFEQVLSHNFIAAMAVKGYWRHSRERDVCERARYTRLAGFNLAQLRLSTACCTSSKWQSERKDQWAWNFNICFHGESNATRLP